MRALAALVLLAAGSAAAAPVATTCYAGTETSEGEVTHVVLQRELDRDKHEVREHHWRETNPTNEVVTTWKVAGDGKTFTWKRGTGTLEGAPWKWTAWHTVVDAQGIKGTTDTKVAGDSLTSKLRVVKDGKTVLATDVEATAFDCKELGKRVAALDDTAPDAKHACYDGKDGGGQRVVIDQITEDKRVKIVTSTAKGDGRIVMAIEGAKIFVKNPAHSWTATGTITGKPGAWTGYEYTLTIGDIDLRSEGTLGGPHFTFKTTGQTGGATRTTAITADVFDCKDLAARRAALK